MSSLSFVQVKETDEVVLSGAYVDLHGAKEASPENLAQVQYVRLKKFSFRNNGASFPFIKIHGNPEGRPSFIPQKG